MAKKKKVRPAPRKSKPKLAKKKKPVAKKAAAKKKPASLKKPAVKRPLGRKGSLDSARDERGAPLGLSSPIPLAWLEDAAGRELALDSLAAWVVSTLQAAQDDAAARETLRVAINSFYDIRQAANQPRGEFAGNFFIVDAVGLGDSNRPVPWQVLAETVSQERLDRFSAIFEEEEHAVG